jgi:hypothetical protein
VRNIRPSATVTSSGREPFSGDAGSTTAVRISLSRKIFAALDTAEPTLAMVRDPECGGALGKRLSPNANRTLIAGRPSASAATCVIDV